MLRRGAWFERGPYMYDENHGKILALAGELQLPVGSASELACSAFRGEFLDETVLRRAAPSKLFNPARTTWLSPAPRSTGRCHASS